MDAAAKDRMAQRALAALGPQTKVLSPKGGWRRAAQVAIPLALAASLALVLVNRSGGDVLPPYEMSMSGGVQALRAEQPMGKLGPSARLELVLRPSRAVEGPVAARLFLIEAGRAREWKASTEVSPDGAVRVIAQGADVGPVASSEVEVAVAVARPDALPSAVDVEKGHQGGRLFRQKVQWE
jgi:hypothetical protein